MYSVYSRFLQLTVSQHNPFLFIDVLVETYANLPSSFKKRLEKYATALLELSLLETPILNALQTDEDATKEDKKHIDDIVDDDIF